MSRRGTLSPKFFFQIVRWCWRRTFLKFRYSTRAKNLILLKKRHVSRECVGPHQLNSNFCKILLFWPFLKHFLPLQNRNCLTYLVLHIIYSPTWCRIYSHFNTNSVLISAISNWFCNVWKLMSDQYQGSHLGAIRAKKLHCGGWLPFLVGHKQSSSRLVILKSRSLSPAYFPHVSLETMFWLISINVSQKSPHFSLLSSTSPRELLEREVTSLSNLKVVRASTLYFILQVMTYQRTL